MIFNSNISANEADKNSCGIVRHDNINICYIGGGSQGWAWKLMSDLYSEEDISGTLYSLSIQSV